ncbi:aldose 1-epimerase [Bradyrhizobium sp. CCGB12]|uniref:aldose 1-epimerase n=1 Tax=Bradyrhizobium sp. CCGB12 TaxID=2949632 RepID=UPI0020B17A33|nr:aldose 1-epimerase [Bradyrhizobium sp. CCGB12]MCP3387805.1 aldose 1-epimerase [Bradyrhizobium sp. CCGB12]
MGSQRVFLSDGEAELEITPSLGAGIARYDFLGPKGREPLFRPAPEHTRDPFALGCNLLAPWSNRISNGGFFFEGRFHPLEPNLPGEPFPIHGNAFGLPWQVQRLGRHSACLSLDSEGPGPFLYRADVCYRLDEGALTVALAITNKAATALPYGLGLHPWFPRTPQTRLLAPAPLVWLEDVRHLPTRRVAVELRPDWDFRSERVLPKGWINNGFEEWTCAARIVWPERSLVLDVAADPPLSTCIIYSPGVAADFLCVEPVSHLVNAHNMPAGPAANGLAILRQGESLAATCRFAPHAVPQTPLCKPIPDRQNSTHAW